MEKTAASLDRAARRRRREIAVRAARCWAQIYGQIIHSREIPLVGARAGLALAHAGHTSLVVGIVAQVARLKGLHVFNEQVQRLVVFMDLGLQVPARMRYSGNFEGLRGRFAVPLVEASQILPQVGAFGLLDAVGRHVLRVKAHAVAGRDAVLGERDLLDGRWALVVCEDANH